MSKFIGGLLLSYSDEHVKGLKDLLGRFYLHLKQKSREDPVYILSGSSITQSNVISEVESHENLPIKKDHNYFSISNCPQKKAGTVDVLYIPTKSSNIFNFTDGKVENLKLDRDEDDINSMLSKLNLKLRDNKDKTENMGFSEALQKVLFKGTVGTWAMNLNFLGVNPSFILAVSGSKRIYVYYLKYYTVDAVVFTNEEITDNNNPLSVNNEKLSFFFLHHIDTIHNGIWVLQSKFLLNKFRYWKRLCADQGLPNRNLLAIGALDLYVKRSKLDLI